MKKKCATVKITSAILIIVALVWPDCINAQNIESANYIWFDEIVGQTNSGLFNGVVYNEEFRVINEKHQFFKKKKHEIGALCIEEQEYYNLKLRYDVFNDNLLVKNGNIIGLPEIILNKDHILSFQIGEYGFKKIITHNGASFVEVLVSKDSLSLYKKHTKRVYKRTDSEVLYHEFKNFKSYILQYQQKLYTIKKLTDLARHFPNHNKKLKHIHKTNWPLKKKNYDAYMKASILDFLELLNNNSIAK